MVCDLCLASPEDHTYYCCYDPDCEKDLCKQCLKYDAVRHHYERLDRVETAINNLTQVVTGLVGVLNSIKQDIEFAPGGQVQQELKEHFETIANKTD